MPPKARIPELITFTQAPLLSEDKEFQNTFAKYLAEVPEIKLEEKKRGNPVFGPVTRETNVAKQQLALEGAKLAFTAADISCGDKLMFPTPEEFIGLMAHVRDGTFRERKPKRE